VDAAPHARELLRSLRAGRFLGAALVVNLIVIASEVPKLGSGGTAVPRGCAVSWRWDQDGSLVLRARLAPDEGARLIGALQAHLGEEGRGACPRAESIATQPDAEGGSAEPPPVDQPSADARVDQLCADVRADQLSAGARVDQHRWTWTPSWPPSPRTPRYRPDAVQPSR
jgi:hypothetical protein